MVLQGWGLSLGNNSHRCPISSPGPQSAVLLTFSTLHICTRPAPISHSFDQSMRCTEWEKIPPILLPLCWPGHCTSLRGPCTVCLSSPFEKSLFGCCCHSEPQPGFPHTPTLWQVQSILDTGSHGPSLFPPLGLWGAEGQTGVCSLPSPRFTQRAVIPLVPS